MSNYEKGTAYENFVEKVYTAILLAEKLDGKTKTITIERRKIIYSKAGAPFVTDIYWEYEIAGIVNQVVIECKNYKQPVDLPVIREFSYNIQSHSGLKGVIVSKSGFTKNATCEATSNKITLLKIREPEDKDLEGYISKIKLNMIFTQGSQTLKLNYACDKHWMSVNGYTETDIAKFSERSDMVIIEDKSNGFRHTIHDLEVNHFYENKDSGEHVWEKTLQDGWIYFKEKALKINFVQIKYINPPNHQSELEIDCREYVLAIMEYLNDERKTYTVSVSGKKVEHDSEPNLQ